MTVAGDKDTIPTITTITAVNMTVGESSASATSSHEKHITTATTAGPVSGKANKANKAGNTSSSAGDSSSTLIDVEGSSKESHQGSTNTKAGKSKREMPPERQNMVDLLEPHRKTVFCTTCGQRGYIKNTAKGGNEHFCVKAVVLVVV